MSIELLAHDVVSRHLHEAAQTALASQLPRSRSSSSAVRAEVAARQLLANGLRALATRLDPCLGCEPSLIVARPR